MSDTWYPVNCLFISLESPGPCWIASRESPWCAYHSRATSYLKPKMHQSWNHGWYSCASFDSKMNHRKFPEILNDNYRGRVSWSVTPVWQKGEFKVPAPFKKFGEPILLASCLGTRHLQLHSTLERSFSSEANQIPRSVKTCRSQRHNPQIKQIGG